MSHAVAVLCMPEAAAGFALAGITPSEVPDASAGAEPLGALAADTDVGVILVQQRVFDAVAPDARRRLARRPLPLVVPFPDPALTPAADDAEAYIIELLRQVVGYRVRLR